jgi:hypothetical protein
MSALDRFAPKVLRVACVVVAIAALAVAVFAHRAAAVDAARAAALRAAVDDVRVDAARVDTLALSVRLASLPSYDPLVDAVAALRRDIRALNVDDNAAAAASVATLQTLVDERTAQIEELKGRRSQLQNSERGLEQLLADGAVDDSLRAPLLAFLLARNEKTEDQLDAARAAAAAGKNAVVARHVHIVLEGRRLIEDTAARFLRAPLADPASQLALVVDDGVDSGARRAELAALLTALAAVVLALWFR